MQFFCVFLAARFDAVDDDRSVDRRTVVLGVHDGSGGEADVAEDAQVCRSAVALRGLVSGYAARTLCAPATQRYVAKRRVLTVRRSSRASRGWFCFVRANAARAFLGAGLVPGLADDAAGVGDGDELLSRARDTT